MELRVRCLVVEFEEGNSNYDNSLYRRYKNIKQTFCSRVWRVWTWDRCLGLSKQPSRLEGTGPHFQGERARKHGACPKTRFAVAGQGREVSVRPLSDVAPFLLSLNGFPAVSRLLRARQLALGPYILSLGSARPTLQRPCRCCFQKNRVPLYLPNIFVRPWYSVRYV